MITTKQAENIRPLLIKVITDAYIEGRIDEQEDKALIEYIGNCEAALKLWNENVVDKYSS